jgi:hypothetical protein
VDELVPVVCADVDEDRYDVARYYLWARVRKLHADGAAHGEDPAGIDAPWVSMS